jgi:hypothetical protein
MQDLARLISGPLRSTSSTPSEAWRREAALGRRVGAGGLAYMLGSHMQRKLLQQLLASARCQHDGKPSAAMPV